MGVQPTTPQLVAAARAGDRSAFEELYTRYVGMVHSIAAARVPLDTAADVVQESFLRALRRLHTLRDSEAFGGWLATIARNASRDAARQLRRAAAVDDEPATHETQPDELEARAAMHAIRALPATYRETLIMRLVQGMTGPEIAEQTGLAPGSVRVNLHRGMRMLRQRLAPPSEQARR